MTLLVYDAMKNRVMLVNNYFILKINLTTFYFVKKHVCKLNKEYKLLIFIISELLNNALLNVRPIK